jgi:hypothetical protein
MKKFIHFPTLIKSLGILTILFSISCKELKVDPKVDSLEYSQKGLRQQATSKDDLPILEVIIDDLESKKALSNKKDKSPKGYTTYDMDPISGACSGTEYLYVGGMTIQQALGVTADLLGQGNLCTIIWTGANDGALGVSVTRTPPSGSTQEIWDVRWSSNGSVAHWMLYGGNTYAGNSTEPVLANQGAGGDNMTALERQVVNSMNYDQQIRYAYNYNTALDRLYIRQQNCGGATNGDGTGNAFLHAYWAVLNARSFGPELALKLVSAHEAFNNNPMSQASMDNFNDMLGIRIARDYPNYSDESIAQVVENRIVTGHGRMLAPDTGIYQATTRSLCE